MSSWDKVKITQSKCPVDITVLSKKMYNFCCRSDITLVTIVYGQINCIDVFTHWFLSTKCSCYLSFGSYSDFSPTVQCTTPDTAHDLWKH